jgi:hypothetical protein
MIHGVFCVQAFLALDRGGEASGWPWLLIYYPHYVIMYFSPPEDPIISAGPVVQVDYLHFLGKMLDAFPASIVYALVLVGLTGLLRRRRESNAQFKW